MAFEDRYRGDVLTPGWQRPQTKASKEIPVTTDLVVEDPSSGFCGAIVGWENNLVVLEDRRGKRRSFPFGPGFWVDGQPVSLVHPKQGTVFGKHSPANQRTRSGSRVAPQTPAKVALPSRIFVEGSHDAELVEKIWGDDLRYVGVAVEFLGGVDDLPAVVDEFAPAPGRRLGVLVDHLVPGSKEARIAAEVRNGRYGDFALVTGHRFIDIWEAIKPERIGRTSWPTVPKGQDWKHGVCEAMGWPHADQSEVGKAWANLLGRVRSWQDLDPRLLTEVETLIDFVTQDHPAAN